MQPALRTEGVRDHGALRQGREDRALGDQHRQVLRFKQRGGRTGERLLSLLRRLSGRSGIAIPAGFCMNVSREGVPMLLSMQGISKSFSGVKALSSASLEIADGEVMALVGQNGAGKSTMIKILTGVYSKDEGSITFAE